MAFLAIATVLLATLLAVVAWLRPPFTAPMVAADGRPAPGSIATLERVNLGGVEQVMLIRGISVTNPVRVNATNSVMSF